MTPTFLLGLLAAIIVVAAVYVLRRVMRDGDHPGRLDVGPVSTRWLSELRRDEPWTRT